MAVLIEAISVVVRADALLRAFGDWRLFKAQVPNDTLCADGELARVGFMTPEDVEAYVKLLTGAGLVFAENGHAKDIVVVDQQRGPTSPCTWIEFGHVSLDRDPAKKVAACRFKGSTSMQIVRPEGWQYEGSLSASFGFVPSGAENKSLEFLGRENGLDVYLNKLTGKKVYIGRTSENSE